MKRYHIKREDAGRMILLEIRTPYRTILYATVDKKKRMCTVIRLKMASGRMTGRIKTEIPIRVTSGFAPGRFLMSLYDDGILLVDVIYALVDDPSRLILIATSLEQVIEMILSGNRARRPGMGIPSLLKNHGITYIPMTWELVDYEITDKGEALYAAFRTAGGELKTFGIKTREDDEE